MRDRPASRKPMAVRLDDPGVTVTVPRAEASDLESRPRPDAVAIVPGAVPAAPPAMSLPAAPRRGVPLGALFWAATGRLVALGFGLAAARLIEHLFSRAEWLGWLGSGLAVVSVATLSAMVTREVLGLARLSTVEKLQARALAALSTDDRNEAGAVVRELVKLLRLQPRLALHPPLGTLKRVRRRTGQRRREPRPAGGSAGLPGPLVLPGWLIPRRGGGPRRPDGPVSAARDWRTAGSVAQSP